MNIVITTVPNPGIRYYKFPDNFLDPTKFFSLLNQESIVSLKVNSLEVRIEKADIISWEIIENHIVDTMKSLEKELKEITFVITKTISETELQGEVENEFKGLNSEIESLINLLR